MWKTEGLKQALDNTASTRRSAAPGATRRRAAPRSASSASATRNHRWDPKRQRPELWSLYNVRKNKGESIRVFPLSNWTELDVWQYIMREGIEIVPLYFAAERPTVERDGLILMVDDERFRSATASRPRCARSASARSAAIRCRARSRARRTTSRNRRRDAAGDDLERQGRAIDRDAGAQHGEEEAGGLFLIDDRPSRPRRDRRPMARSRSDKELLRFITCGSVDDGKSTLIGRLLYDSKQIFDDQLAALEADSKRGRHAGRAIDFALLVDGLSAEREQGITIDVAYRFFATAKRKFIVADTPGHEQYTRNMVTGASTADLAVLLVDARKGVLTQTRRHSYLAQLVGIRRFVLAVNKMDLVDYDQARSTRSSPIIAPSPSRSGSSDWVAIPVSGLNGDNVASRSEAMPWYDGPSLLEHLETVPLDAAADAAKPLRMPVQWVNRPNQISAASPARSRRGRSRPGDEVRILPSGRLTRSIARIVTHGRRPRRSGRRPVGDADPGRRGRLLARRRDRRRRRPARGRRPVRSDDRVDGRRRAAPGRGYWLKLGTQTVTRRSSSPNMRSTSTRSSISPRKTLG
jgi:small GTP-binding protein